MDFIAASEQRIREIFGEEFSKFLKASSLLKEGSQKKYLSVKELSAYLRLSVPSIYKKVADDEIPHHTINARILFEQSEIDQWIAQK